MCAARRLVGMPELPEVECVRRVVEARVVGRVVERVRIVRRDVIATARDPAGGFARNRSARSGQRDARPSRVTMRDLLAGCEIVRVMRRGKRLGIVGRDVEDGDERALDVHLGMTGMVCVDSARGVLPKHAHVVWGLKRHQASGTGHQAERVSSTPHLSPKTVTTRHGESSVATSLPRGEAGELGAVRMVFRDARRFGGIWTCASVEDLLSRRWGSLGPDALGVTDAELGAAMAGSARAVKAVLLDQGAIAGVGNIYADEALFAAGVHPTREAGGLTGREVARVAAEVRRVLAEAVEGGGSTIRDFAGPEGASGSYQGRHAVYGRGGERCARCGRTRLAEITVAQRTTVYCPVCQG